ncbi:MAG: hypothetical protein U5K79_08445 [Cyclobacteriaceae bacterium]|nr:hypothetical protein [Cyclobacteriaceae bacterium]
MVKKHRESAFRLSTCLPGKPGRLLHPCAGNQIGGYYCYLPIPYEKSLKIVYAGNNLRFHQTQYRSLTQNEKMKSFSTEMLHNYKDMFEKI